jgi:hypothetical protein
VNGQLHAPADLPPGKEPPILVFGMSSNINDDDDDNDVTSRSAKIKTAELHLIM